MARRKKRVEHDNHDRWLISYADFVTLLFAFFVVMYSISSVNEGKYKTFSDSLSIAFTNKPSSVPINIAPNEQELLLKALVDRRTARLGEQQRKIQDRMRNLANGLSQVMSPLINQRMVSINQTRRGVVLDISESSLFKTGEAVLQPGVLDVLRQVSAVLSKEELPIEVEGHTDDIPIATVQFPSNWELSSARASSVVRMLIDNGVPARSLAAVGLASNQPLVPNDSQENRARNRRVTIIIVSPDMERVTAPGNAT
ncbi:MAG: flagellar motor protein MotD [Gallionellales bacterium RIFCSPLOWO2_12_FULL_57_18]|nr:MAG: flagellar motor protein MotD [Gallionellales bacterium RIFCSPLOWO2_12_FULL_57_18]OGT16104.1 MAG: flagellar motor protein MotD [Gallionellales bacterium RIFCSPHIGHO2_02_FULL_57_16]